MAVNFYIDRVCDKNGDVRIRAKISITKIVYLTTIGIKIDPKKWNKAKQRVSHGCVNSLGFTYSTINTRLSDIEAYFAKIENAVIAENRTITKEEIRTLFFLEFKNAPIEPAETFELIFKRFILEVGTQNNWVSSNYRKFNNVLNNILRFSKTPTFEMFTDKNIHLYVNFLAKRGLVNTTINKNIRLIKQFLRWCVINKIIPFVDVSQIESKLKTIDRKVIYLTPEELMKVYNHTFKPTQKYLSHVRDVFCFCCFTSLRYSDVANLKRSNIHEDSLQITTIKTHDTIVIELNKFSRAILNKYKDIEFKDDKALPVISNQKMNQYIKEVGRTCEINTPITTVSFRGKDRIEKTMPKYELLSSHVGRKTFVTSALSKGIEPIIVMQWTGHSDYKAMKPYVAIISKAKKDAMKLFDE